jgi:predicted Zn-dependent protease
MVSRAVAVVVFAVSLITFAVAQGPPFGQNGPPFPGQMGGQSSLAQRQFSSISGSVRSANGQPMGNIRVELRDGSTGSIVNSAYTGAGGTFEFRGIPQGSYEVIASSGTQQVEERVDSGSMNAMVDLRLPSSAEGNTAPNDGMGNRSVSVAQYKVPEAAREELRKAREASVKDKHDEAQRHLGKALDLAPNYADALTLRAIYKLDAKDVDGAIEDLNKAIENDANCALAYMALGSAFNMQSKFDDALRTLQRGESLAPDAWQAYFEMGRAYAGKSDFEAAVHALDRAQTLAPAEFPLIRLVRANALLSLNRYGDAAADLEAYLNKNPNGPEVAQAQRMLERARAGMATTQK